MAKLALVSAVIAGLWAAPSTVRAAEAKKAGGGATLVKTADLQWKDLPGREGIKVAVVQGNPDKGPAHFFVKFTPGVAVPQHWHTADHYVAVVAGTMVEVVDGKETELPPGSYWAFTGKKKHETRCSAGSECTVFVDARARWDVVPAAAK